ncbi:MAG: exodeoxyribonuclease III [Alphaproteobacteria bacterium]|nr:exodeoxyribonuclease III [Alphaproteobacteria bacterium]
MKIASFNVNSVKARLPNVLAWLGEAKPDVCLLQETKTEDHGFPRLEFEDLGYNLALHGQKTYNGVAILSKQPLDDVVRSLPGDANDTEARYIEAFTGGIRVASVYVPNGQAVGSDKFRYKLGFLARLKTHAASLVGLEEPVAIGGDFNVAPDDADVHDPAAWRDQVLCHPEERAAFRRISHLGFTDALAALAPGGHAYTWWDYRAGAWPKDHGLRIDHILLSPKAADRLKSAGVDRKARGQEKASDHAPVWCELAES